MSNTEQLRLGFLVENVDIPLVLRPLIDSVVVCYQRHHRDLLSVYVIGSVAIGEWQSGISDIDVIGITVEQPTNKEDNNRRDELAALDIQWPIVTFIDNALISTQVLKSM